jgi:hypothetical protein
VVAHLLLFFWDCSVLGLGAYDFDLFCVYVHDADEMDDMITEDFDRFASIIRRVECLRKLGMVTYHHLSLLQPTLIFLYQI